ncbi:unnamed protein product [Closterium sp. Yama58-4]|nr:unnamed protein product [Closterium sp. Yama58-4]
MAALPLARAHQLCAPLIPPFSPSPYLRSAPLPPLSAIPASPLCRRRTPLAPLRGAARRRAIALRAQAAAAADEGKEPRGGVAGERSSGGVKRVVVLGGSGRVGRSTAVALAALAASDDEATRADFQLELIISGRNRGRGEAVCEEVRAAAGAAGSAVFIECDITHASALDSLLSGADLVVHCAGPFQREPHCTVLEAAIRTKTPYVDVCDDVAFAANARSLHGAAVAAGVPAITTAGIYPGVSNLMAAELVRLAGEEGARMEEQQGQQQAALGLRPKSLRTCLLSGSAILSTHSSPPCTPARFSSAHNKPCPLPPFPGLLASRQRLQLPAYSQQRLVDFGPGVGERSTYLLNLPEVVSAHEVLGVPTVSARFGTAPHMWNWAMHLLRSLLPQVRPAASVSAAGPQAVQRMVGALEPLVLTPPPPHLPLHPLPGAHICQAVLQDCSAVQRMAGVLEPLVRAADGSAGERVAMRVSPRHPPTFPHSIPLPPSYSRHYSPRSSLLCFTCFKVDLETENGRSTTALFSHRRLSVSVGVATAAFAVALLEGTSLPGVHYPEQAEAIPVAQRELLLQRAALGARFFAINKPGWMIEREPKQIGMGLYI